MTEHAALEALVERARDGDEEAFAGIVDLQAPRVYRLVLRLGLAQAEAEEVSQEVFLRAWRSFADFRGQAAVSTWLYRIAYNEAHRRLAHREPESVGSENLDHELDTARPGPETSLLHRELSDQITLGLRRLPMTWRVAVVLRDIEGLSTDAAAEVVGIRPTAFKSRLHRGRMQLRALLEPYLELGAG